MQVLLRHMDDFIIHWGAIPRRRASPLPLQVAGYMAAKRHWERRAFDTCNFSLILSGRGSYLAGGRRWQVTAPYVLTQWPNEPLEYGPSEGETWEELFLIYSPDEHAQLRRCGFLEPSRPCWKIAHGESWREALDEAVSFARTPREGLADRMDRICDRLILESLLHERPEREPSPGARAIALIRESVRTSPAAWPDFRDVARRLGLSPQSLRRSWAKETRLPPTRFLHDLKIKEACRLLIETRQSASEIAYHLGYEDPLYFSRRFRALLGSPATAYRRQYQVGQ